MNPKQQLEVFINERFGELEAYSLRPDAKGAYLRRQNEQLSKLTEICTDLESLQYYDLWVFVEAEWRKVKKQDSNFGGIAVELYARPNGILCRLPIPLYHNGI